MKKGIESLKAAVIHDTESQENCFNENWDKEMQIITVKQKQ